jgi:hypothetical protein
MVKLGFVLVTIAVIAVVWYLQRRGKQDDMWVWDLPAAMAKAKAENRPLLVMFEPSPPGETVNQIVTNARKNEKAVQAGRHILVRVRVDTDLKSDVAKQYALVSLPTLLVLRADGTEATRHEGIIGEQDFRNKLLAAK